jgi:glycosyltransferase 2 family protein
MGKCRDERTGERARSALYETPKRPMRAAGYHAGRSSPNPLHRDRNAVRRLLILSLRIAVAIGALVVALTLVDARPWAVALRNPAWFALALAAWLVNQVGCAWRFRILAGAAGIDLAFATAFKLGAIGFFAGCVFGGFAANDAARTVLLKHHDSALGLRRLVFVLLLDRTLGFLGFAAWAFLHSFAIAGADGGARVVVATIQWVGYAMLVALAILAVVSWRLRHALETSAAAPASRPRALLQFVLGWRIVAGLLAAFPASMLATGALIETQGWIGAQALASLGEPPAIAAQSFLAPASIIISILPIVPLGIGVGQLTLAGLYSLFGLPAQAAVMLTTLMQAAQLAVALALGAPMLASIRRAGR